jgi:hypothetical protein
MDMGRAAGFAAGGTRFAQTARPDGELRLLTSEEIAEPAFVAAWERLALRACKPNPVFEPWYLLS